MDGTLDLPEVQVLVNYPVDADGFFWHHRILLCRIEGSRWLTLTPDHHIQQDDLGLIHHRVLDRRSNFPGDIVDEIYAHDPSSRGVLNGFKRQAQTMAVILGEGTLPDGEAVLWVVSDPMHEKFGERLRRNSFTTIGFFFQGCGGEGWRRTLHRTS